METRNRIFWNTSFLDTLVPSVLIIMFFLKKQSCYSSISQFLHCATFKHFWGWKDYSHRELLLKWYLQNTIAKKESTEMIVSLLLSLPSDFHIEIITSGDVSAESSMLLSLQKKRKKDGRQQHSDNNMASMLDILIRHKVSQFKYSDSLALSPSLFVCLCVYMLPVFIAYGNRTWWSKQDNNLAWESFC